MGFLGFGKNKDEEDLKNLHKEVISKGKKRNPIEVTKERLAKLKADTYQDYAPQPAGERLWWVLSYIDEDIKVDGPYYSAYEADIKLSEYEDGEVFELRNIEKKQDAKKAIREILEDRKKGKEVQHGSL